MWILCGSNWNEWYVHTDSGSGDGAVGSSRDCDDKILMPCDSEEFIMVRVLLLLAVNSVYNISSLWHLGHFASALFNEITACNLCAFLLTVFVLRVLSSYVCMFILFVFVVPYVYLLYYVCIAVLTLDARLLARSQ